MNITEDSAKRWLKVKSYNANSGSGSNDNQGTSSPQVWDLRWFALLSGPLLFGTIILPLITGQAIQYLCRSYVTLRVYWRLGIILLAIAYPILFYSLTYSNSDWSGTAFTMLVPVCDTTMSLYVGNRMFFAWRFKRRRRFWIFCSLLHILVVSLDFFLHYVFQPFGYFGWIVMLLIELALDRREGIQKKRADIRGS